MTDELRQYLISAGISPDVISSNEEKIDKILQSLDPKISKRSAYAKIEKYLMRPNFIEQAHNALNSVATFISNGLPKTEPNEIQKRMDICLSCEYFNNLENRCNKCGCFLNIKTAWATEKCPIGKW